MRTPPPAATVAAMRRTVLIVDDHSAFRSAARALLEDAGFQVVGEAEDGESAIAAARELRPDIVLLDIQLPDVDGFAVAERLDAQGVPTAIVLTSSRSVAGYRRRLAAHPSWPFVAKSDLSGATLAAAAAG
jgi:DNA-binding NarL/FixJ family response regulator